MEITKTQQEPTMNTEPQKKHQWLQKLVGEWTYETEAMMSPDQPSERATGTESVRSIGVSSTVATPTQNWLLNWRLQINLYNGLIFAR
ncbi:MAG: DUF1579 family protein [Nostoc sp.]|uniref:DUF1579 family protein n=1 Tax=Nostoc sp. TaxID=1180 RepID=UPI002FF542A4